MWQYIRQFILFFVAFVAMCFALFIYPPAAIVGLAIFLWQIPRTWRAMTGYNTEVAYRRKRQNIETQIIQGRLDGQMITDTVRDMRRNGRI